MTQGFDAGCADRAGAISPASALARLSLLRLGSPSLPIGGYSYSQGLEAAIDRGWIRNAQDVRQWLGDLLACNVGRFEAPIVLSVFVALHERDSDEAWRIHERYLAARETAELRAETLQMGYSMLQLLAGLDTIDAWTARQVDAIRETRRACALPMAWGLAARAFGLEPGDALSAWLWAWLENQVMAAMKAIPLGQQAGQRLLSAISGELADVIARAANLPESEWSSFAHGFAMASSWHENQYSRLFRS